MKQYLEMLQHILDKGSIRTDRTGVGTIGTFGYQTRFDLREGFPLLTTKKMFSKGIVAELLWIISGSTNVKPLQDQGVRIWNEWADADGELGPVYGQLWRAFPHFEADDDYGDFTEEPIDQLANVIAQIKSNPDSRRHIVTAWHPGLVSKQKLPPCHCFFQFYVSDGALSLMLTQRSCDAFLGAPFNIASYALLTHLVAQVCGLKVGELIYSVGDLHIYHNHLEQVLEQLKRAPKPLPTLWLDASVKDIDAFRSEHIRIDGYTSWPAIKGEVAV